MSSAAPSSLLRRLLVRIGLVVLALLLAGGAISYLIARHYSDAVHDRWLYDSARTLAAQVRVIAQRPQLDLPDVALEMFIWDEKDQIYYEVTSKTRGRIAGNARFDVPATPAAARGGRFFDTTQGGRPIRAVAVAVDALDATEPIRVIVGETLNKRTALAGEILIATIPVQLLLIAAGALALLWSLRSGLTVVAATTAAIRSRNPLDLRPVSLSAPAPAEIAPLIVAINDLMSRVDQAQRAQQRFVANAAHQLRTPVATLQVQVERALREPDAAGQKTALAHVDLAVKRLSHLLHQILTLARVERDGDNRITHGPCNLGEIAASAVESHIDDALTRGCDLGYAGPPGTVIVDAQALLLKEALGNLIENALHYAGAGLHVTVGAHDGPPRLFVEDNGPGIPATERDRVWERFYRIPGTPGFGCGLGLAIVKEIADRHGATVSLEAAQGDSGTRVTITFAVGPRHQPDSAVAAAPATLAANAKEKVSDAVAEH